MSWPMIGGVRADSSQPPFLFGSGACLPVGSRERSQPPGAGLQTLGLSLEEWACLALAPFLPAAHHRLLLTELGRLADDETDRLLVAMPPGSAKSTYCSVLLPAWWLQRHP